MTDNSEREMQQPDDRISAALRSIPGTDPQEAPPELYAKLASAFRSHHVRRRRIQTAVIFGLAACFAMVAIFVRVQQPANNTFAIHGNSVTPEAPRRLQAPGSAELAVAKQSDQTRMAHHAARTAPREDFDALPSFDASMPTEDLRIVRMELPGADLRLVGAQVSEEVYRRRVVADFVVGHDGTPYAMRLVQ